MNINIASKNPVKIEALKEMLLDYKHLQNARVESIDVSSGVSDQPKSLEETITGAKNRARKAYSECDYSFGIESGLITVPYTKSGYMDVCACAIFDGSEYHLGLSSAWEAPERVSKLMLEDGLDMNEAAYKAGYTDNMKVGSAQGLVGIMTKGRLTRKEYTKEAIRTSLIHIDN
ncbi:inosine/xanthosine triphosphatase [Patescibacteria group bacterium]|nr:inosine/xanthosine triphosphatase [Patescibacteria group bacterium]